MTQLISRIQFIRGDFEGTGNIIRPPWAIDENQFTAACNSCGNCIETCPTSILSAGRGNYPVVDFNNSGCEFCGECVKSCPTQALTLSQDSHTLPWTIKAKINDSCLAMEGIVCQVCAEFCESSAIKFTFLSGRTATPQLELDKCTGCGACISSCPTNAITTISFD